MNTLLHTVLKIITVIFTSSGCCNNVLALMCFSFPAVYFFFLRPLLIERFTDQISIILLLISEFRQHFMIPISLFP